MTAKPVPRPNMLSKSGRRQALAEQAPGLRVGGDFPHGVDCPFQALAALPGADPVAEREPDEHFHGGYISLISR